MFCTHCGWALPNDANFCPKCGKPQQAGVQPNIEEQYWEICRIGEHRKTIFEQRRFFGRSKRSVEVWYYAQALGPRGKYIAGKSRRMVYESTSKYDDGYESWIDDYDYSGSYPMDLRDELFAKLVGDGWEPILPSSYHLGEFRRRVR